MTWMTALTGGQVTQVRTTDQEFEHYLLVNPNDIVWQGQINDPKSAENYGSFTWNNEQAGVRANVMEGMVCLITTSITDFSAPILRGRVRLVPSATVFFINEESINLDNTMYVTVFDDFDIFERLARVGEGGTKYKDFAQTWQDLPPTIDGLQSVYADLSGAATFIQAFTPTAIAHTSGAAIDTWSWDVGDGTITVGVSTDQDITVSFPIASEHRWVHLTVTDDNGLSTVFHFEVYTVDPTSATAVKLNAGTFSITGTITEGFNGTVAVWDGFDVTEVYDQTRVAIVSIDNYAGTATPITSNIMLVGRLRTEESQTEGDETQGTIQSGQFNIEGFGTQLARIVAQSVYIVDTTTPSDWGEIVNPNPTRAIVFFLIWNTTFLTLSSFSTDDFSAFTGEDWSLAESSAIDHINQQAMTVNAEFYLAPSGECTVRRLASYTPSGDRAALTTILDFTTADTTVFALPIEYGQNIGEVETGGVIYNTTLDETTLKYIARAPAQSFGSGYESTQLDGQQLTADASDADARTEIAQRSADHLAFVNPKERITATFMDGFWWMIPNRYQRFTFAIAASDTVRGRIFTSGNYWQLVDISYSPSNEEGSRPVQATFERETTGANAGILVSRVPDINALDFSLPPFGAYNDFPDDPLVNYPDDDPDDDLFGGGDFGPEPPGNNKGNAVGTEVLEVPMYTDDADATTNIAQFGEEYRVIVEGDGIVGGTEIVVYDFRESQWGWVPTSGGAVYVNGAIGWEDVDLTTGPPYTRSCNITKNLSESIPTVTLIKINFPDYVPGNTNDTSRDSMTIRVNDSLGDGRKIASKTFATGFFERSLTYSGATLFSVTQVRGYLASSSWTAEDTYQGDAPIQSAQLNIGGTARGDAFYKNYNLDQQTSDTSTQRYGAGLGLLINGAQPVGVGDYMGSHRYEFLVTGNNSVLTFRFQDSDYTDNDRNKIKITVSGPGMGPNVI